MTSSTITTIPSSFECYTCEINFISSTLPFTLYQCNTCNEKTPFCANCVPIITKLFGQVIFKCKFCNSIDKAITKEEIIRQSQNCCSIFAHTSNKTPLKSSLIPSNNNNNNQQTNKITFQSSTTNLPLFMNEEQKSNFNDDFNNKLIVSNISSSNNSSDTPMMPFSGNEAFISKYTLLSKKKQGTSSTLKKFILNSGCNNNNNSCSSISENQNNSFCDSEFAGYNKKMKRTPMLTKSKYMIQQCHNNKSMNENGINISTCSINNHNNSMINITNNNESSNISSPFSSSALQKLSFSNNVDEFGNRKNVAGFGMRCQLGGSYNNGNIDTPHKFNINLNLTPSSFQINPM